MAFAFGEPVGDREQHAGDDERNVDSDLPAEQLPGVNWSTLMNALSSSTAEIATMAPMSLIFRSENPTLPIHAGRSSWSPMLIFETKFS